MTKLYIKIRAPSDVITYGKERWNLSRATDSVGNLPKWAQRRLAVLMAMAPDDHWLDVEFKNGEAIEGYGQNFTVYTVVKQDEPDK